MFLDGKKYNNLAVCTNENMYLRQGLENRLKYSQKDLETSKKSIATFEKKLQELEAELNGVAVSTPTSHTYFVIK